MPGVVIVLPGVVMVLPGVVSVLPDVPLESVTPVEEGDVVEGDVVLLGRP